MKRTEATGKQDGTSSRRASSGVDSFSLDDEKDTGIEERATVAWQPPAPDEVRAVRITVSIGEETHSPIQYQSFRAGAVSAEFVVPEGVSVEQAHAAALAKLRKLSEVQFEEQLRAFFEHAREASSRASRR